MQIRLGFHTRRSRGRGRRLGGVLSGGAFLGDGFAPGASSGMMAVRQAARVRGGIVRRSVPVLAAGMGVVVLGACLSMAVTLLLPAQSVFSRGFVRVVPVSGAVLGAV